MRRDSRLSRLLHVLIHMDRHEGFATSEAIARMVSTNPVLVRRMLAGLREAGHLRSVKGHGGGWALARPLDKITLLDVYRSIGSPGFFALGLAEDNPRCLVEQAVNIRLAESFGKAEALLLESFGTVTLADLSADFERRMTELGLEPDRACHDREAG